MKEGISFVTAADDGFHQGLSALLKTFILSNRDLAPLDLIVMDCGLKAEFVDQLQQEIASFSTDQAISLSLQFQKPDLTRWQVFPAHWESYAAYAFLEAIQMIQTRHLVFADADILHFKNLSSTINELNHSTHQIAGVVDDAYDVLEKDFYVNHLSPLEEHQRHAPYINSGYLIFDLERFSHSAFLSFLKDLSPEKSHERFKGVKKFKHDQTILNAFIKGDCLLLDESFNYLCKENQKFRNIDSRKNFHFVSNPKPWHSGTLESKAREVTFLTTEHVLNRSEKSVNCRASKYQTIKFLILINLYKILGKKKKKRRYENALIKQAELESLRATITDWCQ